MRDRSLEQAHGALVLNDREGDGVHDLLGDVESTFGEGARQCVAVYASLPTAKVSPAVLRRYPIIQGAAPPAYDWVAADARSLTLDDYLISVQARAARS